MLKKASFLLFLVVFFLSTRTKAQTNGQFSGDTLKFPKELGEYFFEFAANKKEATQFILDFTQTWKSPDFPSKYKKVIIETCNLFLQKRLKPYPYFASYINSVISFINSEQPPENFQDWQKCVNKILAGKSIRGFSEFLEISGTMFEGNAFFSSPTYTYKSQQANFKFEYDTIPKITFTNITLIGLNPRKDSMYIEQTSGVFFPTFGKFYGKGGKVSWVRAGLGDDVYADLKRFVIDCKTGNYTSDSAVFYGKQYFDKPQLGKITDRIITENNSEPTYPRFDSYSKRLLVKNIYPDVDYDGGFGMRGPKFVGSGNAFNPARIIFRRNNQRFMEISARAFAMSKTRVVANPGVVKIFLDKDSIYHPGLSFNYDVDKKLVTILRGDDGLQKTPFSNSFHRYDMYFEQLVWKTDEPKMSFGFLPNNFQGEAFFESFDFYTGDRIDNLRGKDNYNLINKLIEFDKANGNQPFTVVDLAKFLKVMAIDLRPTIFKYHS